MKNEKLLGKMLFVAAIAIISIILLILNAKVLSLFGINNPLAILIVDGIIDLIILIVAITVISKSKS